MHLRCFIFRRVPQVGQTLRQDEHRWGPVKAAEGGHGLRDQGREGLHQKGRVRSHILAFKQNLCQSPVNVNPASEREIPDRDFDK